MLQSSEMLMLLLMMMIPNVVLKSVCSDVQHYVFSVCIKLLIIIIIIIMLLLNVMQSGFISIDNNAPIDVAVACKMTSIVGRIYKWTVVIHLLLNFHRLSRVVNYISI